MGVLESSRHKRSTMENSDQKREHKNKLLKSKENKEILKMLISNKFKEGGSDIEGVNNSCRVTNDIMNDWMETNMVQCIVNERMKS